MTCVNLTQAYKYGILTSWQGYYFSVMMNKIKVVFICVGVNPCNQLASTHFHLNTKPKEVANDES